jgi:hypothetical protein
MLPQQRQVIATTERPDRRATFTQGLEVAFRREPLADRLRDVHVVGPFGKNVDDAVEQDHEVFDLIALLALDDLQFITRRL